ncbi:MAG: hypothetical protein WC745_04450 [Patescibacteria group bacterium]|jgi:hypothetical protein
MKKNIIIGLALVFILSGCQFKNTGNVPDKASNESANAEVSGDSVLENETPDENQGANEDLNSENSAEGQFKADPDGRGEMPMVGNDRDEHGCIPSAGYSWCEAKKKCLRIWEERCE